MDLKMKKIHQLMDQYNLDGILVTSFENRRYATGFSGSNGLAYITEAGIELWTDQRYEIQAEEQAPHCRIDIAREPFQTFCSKKLRQLSGKRIGFESNSLTVSEFEFYREAVPEMHWHPLNDELLKIRAVKTAEEIEAVHEAVRKADLAFSKLLPTIRTGVTEMELKVELEYLMAKEGHEGAAFGTIVAFGERAALPHAVPTNRKLANGEFALIDFGLNHAGYMSDMTRTIKYGTLGEDENRIFDLTLKGLEASIAAVRPGMDVGDLDAVHRRMFKEAGVEQYSLRGLGHGVGLQIHENPRVVENGIGLLEEDMVFTIEPGLYFPGKFGVRIEDIVRVTADGYEVLTGTPREIRIG